MKRLQLPKNKFARLGINILLIAGWFYFWLRDILFGLFNNNIDRLVHHITYKILSMDLYEDDFIFVFLKYSILIIPPILFIKYIWFNKAKITRSKD